MTKPFLSILGIVSLLTAAAEAAFTVNSAMPIDRRLTVQVIQVANDDGSNPAPLFGSASAQSTILAGIDTIWAQAGIDVEFKFRLSPYADTFALSGTASNRPTSDLNTIVSQANAEGGVLDPNNKVINLFVVRVVPGFSQTSDNTSNGLAFVGGNGITLWVGPNLTTFASGREVVSSVLAHEIGHNLGLSHLETTENLMQSGGDGERLTAGQISTARSSSFLVSVPEPSTMAVVATGLALCGLRRKRSKMLS